MTKHHILTVAFGAVFLIGAAYLVATGPSAEDDIANRGASAPVATSDEYTASDVEQHNGAASCWTSINGGVYDLTDWVNSHPGGVLAILGLCGRDGSTAFNAVHGGQEGPAGALERYKIGSLIATEL